MSVIRLYPVLKDYLWGGYRLHDLFGRDNGGKKIAESWEVSVHPDGESKTEEGTLPELLHAHPELISPCKEFPVLIKYIDSLQNLSVQVHPGDEYARRVEGDNGKTEMWYILQAEEGAGIYCGFRRDVTPEEFRRALDEGSVEKLLNFIPVHRGDCYLIEAGTVHAICAGCVICEVQQSSNVTYRVYDYNRRDAQGNLRPLHIEKAMDVIDFSAFRDRTNRGEPVTTEGGTVRLLTQCDYFRCRELTLGGRYTESAERSFLAVNVLEGRGEICGKPFEGGDSFLVPRGEELVLCGEGKVLITDLPKKYYAGVDLGGTRIKCGIVDSAGNLLHKVNVPTGRVEDYRSVSANMAKAVLSAAKGANVQPEEIEAVGIGAPGTIDSEHGEVIYSNNLAWNNVPLASLLSSKLGKPVFLANDANVAALGESKYGAGKCYSSLILITLGTGVGGGIVLDGKLFEGNRSAGGEIGHHVIRAGGERCTCGRRGCLEAYASATALIRDTRRAMQRHPESALFRFAEGGEPDGKTAFLAAKAGDAAAKRVVSRYLSMLAEGIVNLVNIFRPEAILLGGGVCAEGDAVILPLRKKIAQKIYGGAEYAPVVLQTASLGNDAGIFGAVALARAKGGKS